MKKMTTWICILTVVQNNKKFRDVTLRQEYPMFYIVTEPDNESPNQQKRHFCCKFCSYCTRNRQHMMYHEVKHTGARPFQCLLCQRAFSAKSSLRR
ncbi:hypothetical protein X975_17653, partial [Stegodyphus mimosarum]